MMTPTDPKRPTTAAEEKNDTEGVPRQVQELVAFTLWEHAFNGSPHTIGAPSAAEEWRADENLHLRQRYRGEAREVFSVLALHGVKISVGKVAASTIDKALDDVAIVPARRAYDIEKEYA